MSENHKYLAYMHWAKKLHKVLSKHHFVAGSSKCTTKSLSRLLTKVFTTIKDGAIGYYNTKSNRNGISRMEIVENSKSLLSSLDKLGVRTAKSSQDLPLLILCTIG